MVDDLMKGKTHVKQLVEIYSKMYYTLQVKPDMACDSQDSKISSVHDRIMKQFKAEPQEIQDEVMRICDVQSSISQKTRSTIADDEETYPDVDVDTRIRFLMHHLLGSVLRRHQLPL